MQARQLAMACVAVLLAALGEARAATLFAIHEANVIAEALPYGPVAITESDSAFLSTLVAGVSHDVWTQIAVDGSNNELYEIRWEFASTKTVAQRFEDAVVTGEAVTWTVNGTDIFSGTWRFSANAGAFVPGTMLARFGSSGPNTFSNDNGAWGVGNGTIDGSSGNATQMAWGYGNFIGGDGYSASDTNGTLRLNGVTQASLPAGFKNFMYVGEFPPPPVDPEMLPAPEPSSLLLFGCGAWIMLARASRRRARVTTSPARCA